MKTIKAFSEARLPAHLSLGASGGPEYSTDVMSTISGHEIRNVKWMCARSNYDIAPSIKCKEDVEFINNFFRAHKGMAIGFRFKDWTDCSAKNQFIAEGDGVKTEFQLIKSYEIAGLIEYRKISKPVLGSVQICVDGKLVDFSLHSTTGIFKLFSPPAKNSRITADFEFDVPVRFGTDELKISADLIENRNFIIPLTELKV